VPCGKNLLQNYRKEKSLERKKRPLRVDWKPSLETLREGKDPRGMGIAGITESCEDLGDRGKTFCLSEGM